MSKTRALVTGASGFLAYNLIRELRGMYELTGWYRSNDPAGELGIDFRFINIADPQMLEDGLKAAAPEIIFHLAAISNANHCEVYQEQSYKINVSATQSIVNYSKEHDCKLIFTSSDLVFDGESAPYNEQATTNPISVYGIQKEEAEAIVLSHAKGIVCRMPLMFGRTYKDRFPFLEPFQNQLKGEGIVRLFTDEFRTPIAAHEAAKGLALAATHEIRLLHLAGPERISRWEFGQKILRAFNWEDQIQTEATLQSDFKMAARRPSDVSLDSSAAKRIGFNPPPLDEQLAELSKEYAAMS